jgi:hypothetical protein
MNGQPCRAVKPLDQSNIQNVRFCPINSFFQQRQN